MTQMTMNKQALKGVPLKRPKICFDWEGTLSTHPLLYQMAIDLQFGGWDVMILSAMPENIKGQREKEIEDHLAKELPNARLPYKVVYHSLENYHNSAAMAKAKYMKDNDIKLLVDDIFEVAYVVRQQGLTVLKV